MNGSRWSSGLWQWTLVAAVVAAIVCVVGWPRLTLCAVGALIGVGTLVAGIRRFAGERRASALDVSGQYPDSVRTVSGAPGHHDAHPRDRLCAAFIRLIREHSHSSVIAPGYMADAALGALAPELDALADYRACVAWDTTCTEHARLLGQLRAAEERAERAEAVVAQAREIHQRVPVKPWPEGPSFSPVSHCTCGGRWPCPTVRALEPTNTTEESR